MVRSFDLWHILIQKAYPYVYIEDVWVYKNFGCLTNDTKIND